MSRYQVATGAASVNQKHVAKIFQVARQKSFFHTSGIAGGTEDSLLFVNQDLKKMSGDVVNFYLSPEIEPTIISGEDADREGQGQATTLYRDSVTIDAYSIILERAGVMTKQRVTPDLTKDEENKLASMKAEALDIQVFDKLRTKTYPQAQRYYGGTVSATATESTDEDNLAAGDKMTPELIEKMHSQALKYDGTDSSQAAFRPIMIDGDMYFLLLTSYEVFKDLRRDPEFAQARRDAMSRKDSHPLFKGEDTLLWNGVIVKPHRRIQTLTNSSSVTYTRSYFMGAQALLWAWGREPWGTVYNYNHGFKEEIAFHWISGVEVAEFNSKPYSIFRVATAHTIVSSS